MTLFWKIQMTHQGIDVVDGTRPRGPGIGVGSRLAHVRKLCLDVIDKSRPGVITESALLACIQSVYQDADCVELRRALHYLEISGLLTINPTTVPQISSGAKTVLPITPEITMKPVSDRLACAIEVVEAGLAETQRQLTPKKKAALIWAAYDLMNSQA